MSFIPPLNGIKLLHKGHPVLMIFAGNIVLTISDIFTKGLYQLHPT